MPAKLNTEIFIERAKQVHGDKYDYGLVVYQRNCDKINIICPDHGKFKQSPKEHLIGQGCPECAGVKKSNSETFIERAKSLHGDKYDYSLTEYNRSSDKVTIICPEHGKFQQRAKKHLEGRGCSECGRLKKSNVESFLGLAKQVHGDKYDYSEVNYNRNCDKVAIVCPRHGVFYQTPSNHLKSQGCKKCFFDGRIKDTEYFIKKARGIHGEEYDYSQVDYEKSTEKVTIICPIHGEFYQTPNNHLRGRSCAKCLSLGGPSKEEYDLLDFIKTFYTGTILTSDRTYIKPKELDIVLPDINLAIEFDGLYWHSEAIKEDKNYHHNKTIACRRAGLRLIHVFESEWVNTPEIVESRLKQLIGAQTNRIYARQCSVKKLTSNEAKDFFNRTHIQGHIGNRITLGLIHNDKIVSAMSFGKPRYNKDYDFELLRFSNELNTSVVGGASKLFKNFQRLYNSPSVISYADLRWSDGNLYEVLGFDFVRQSSPNYYYFKGTSLELESRIKYQKHKLPKILDEFDEALSETENMALNGYNRIFDCGNAVYTYNP